MFHHQQEINQANMSIGIEMISPKQLIGECLDFSTAMLKDIIEAYCQKNHFDLPFPNQVPFPRPRKKTSPCRPTTSSTPPASKKYSNVLPSLLRVHPRRGKGLEVDGQVLDL